MILANSAPTRTPSRHLYRWLLAGLCLFLAFVIFRHLAQNMPESKHRDERIERIQHSQQCNANEVVVVTEFAPHVYKAYCAAKG